MIKARQKEAEETKKVADANEKQVKALAELADRYRNGRMTGDEFRKAIEDQAKAMGMTKEALGELVEKARQELEWQKEHRSAAENSKEVNEQLADSLHDVASAIDDVIAARKREREETDAASDAETRARAKDADAGGGPAAWLKDLDGAKAQVDALAESVANVGRQWIVAREAVVTYQGTLRDASEESRALDESQQALLDTLTKIARSNEKTSAWMTQYIDELQRAMELGGKGWADQGKMLDEFMDKVRNTHYWMSQMNAEFVLGGSMYGDVSRDFGSLAGALDQFRQSLIGK
jgi:predicted ribosome quality control (RQC) complex YloA/Tae2 family protein